MLYPCPYERSVKCLLQDPCLTCETFGEYQNTKNKPVRLDEVYEGVDVEQKEGKTALQDVLSRLDNNKTFDDFGKVTIL